MYISKILEEILDLATKELNEKGSIDYTTPNGKYHLYISVKDGTGKNKKCYNIEPIIAFTDGNQPVGENQQVEYNDFAGLLARCAWCIESCFTAD